MRSKRAVVLGVLAVSAVLLAACAGSGATVAPAATAAPYAAERGAFSAATGVAVGAPQAVPADGAKSQPAQNAGSGDLAIPRAFDPDRKLILTATVSLEAKDPWSVSDQVQGIAVALGGDVLQLAQSGKGDQKSATLTIRVPQAQFNDALRRIRDVDGADVVSSNVQGQDVTDQFVDLQARLTAKQAEEQRYLALLARADKIDDILKIDATLAQVRTQVEQLQGQIDSIKSRTTYSTIAVQVSPLGAPAPRIEPKVYDPAKTAAQALSALAGLMRLALDAAIWTLVFAWIPLFALGLVLLLTRARSRIAPTV